MKAQEVICTKSESTDWVNDIVTPFKMNGDLSVSLDPRPLNGAIKREHYKLPMRLGVMAHLSNAKYFSKWMHQMASGKLDEKSSKLPFERKRFLRLPFGVKNAPEIYHKAVHQLFEHI